MSLDVIKPYFRLRCNSIGLVEHEDAFNIENIPDTLADGSYHISFLSFSGIKSNQNDQELLIPIEVVFFKKGYRYPSEGIDNALTLVESLIKEVQRPQYRLGTVIKNITTGNCDIEQQSLSNDNIVMVRIVFNLIMTLDLI